MLRRHCTSTCLRRVLSRYVSIGVAAAHVVVVIFVGIRCMCILLDCIVRLLMYRGAFLGKVKDLRRDFNLSVMCPVLGARPDQCRVNVKKDKNRR